MKKKEGNNSILGKSILQSGVGLLIFVLLLTILWFIVYLLKNFFGITFLINNNDLGLTLAILATFGISMYIYNSNKLEKEKDDTRKQMDLLNILLQELNFLKKNLKAYRKTFSGEKTYPFYELWSIDTSLYFKGLSHEIGDKETVDLKKNLMIIKDKILLVNNMKSESYRLEERGGEERVAYAIKVIRKQIGKIIDKDILPVVKESEKMVDLLMK